MKECPKFSKWDIIFVRQLCFQTGNLMVPYSKIGSANANFEIQQRLKELQKKIIFVNTDVRQF